MQRIIFNGSSYKTSGDLPSVGSRAPDVSLVNTDLNDVSLANWMGKRKVMNIFPSIDTPVCARSVVVFDALASGYEDVVTLMISCDLPFTLKRFIDDNNLARAVGLSAIRNAGFGDNYGVLVMDGPLTGMFARAVVVLDENNTVVHSEQVANIGDEPRYEDAWKALGIKVDMDAVPQ